MVFDSVYMMWWHHIWPRWWRGQIICPWVPQYYGVHDTQSWRRWWSHGI